LIWLALALLLPQPPAGVAQVDSSLQRGLWLDLDFNATLVISGDLLDDGFGLEAGIRLMHPSRWLGLRATAGFLALGGLEHPANRVVVDNTLYTLLQVNASILAAGELELAGLGLDEPRRTDDNVGGLSLGAACPSG